MKKLLITRPNYDKATGYLNAGSTQIIDAANDIGWVVYCVDGQKANKKEVQSKLEKIRPSLIVFNGHGSESEIFGHKSEVIIGIDSTVLLKDSIVFTRACDCLLQLGGSAVSNGCKAFIGYSSQFWIPTLKNYEATPQHDPVARPVLEASNVIPIKLIKNSTVQEAVEAARHNANKHILRLVQSEELYDRATLKALIQNDDCLGFKGDQNAKVE